MMNVIMLNVIMLNAIMPTVVAPLAHLNDLQNPKIEDSRILFSKTLRG
jgi:hypothetical protein